MKNRLILALAVALVATAGIVYASQRRNAALPGVVIQYRWTKNDREGRPKVGARTSYFIPTTGEFRTVKQMEGQPSSEHGFSREFGAAGLGRRADGTEFLEVNSKVPAAALAPVPLNAEQLKLQKDFAGTVEVAGETAYTIRENETVNGVSVPSYEASYLPGLAFPVRVVWYDAGVPFDTAEAVSIERRPVSRDELMVRYDGLPREKRKYETPTEATQQQH